MNTELTWKTESERMLQHIKDEINMQHPDDLLHWICTQDTNKLLNGLREYMGLNSQNFSAVYYTMIAGLKRESDELWADIIE